MRLQSEEIRKRYDRPHDRWQCSLDETSSCGGSGTHRAGEDKCSPVPSLRMQRGIFSVSCTAMLLGLLLACWNSPMRNEFLAPGPLTSHHAQILVADGTDRCAACHGAGDKTLGAWIQDAISSGKHIPISQSQLCMDCHEQSLAAEFALHAHNLSPESLATITDATVPDRSSYGFPDPRNAAGELACATCHREHHGAEFNLTALTDRQCQTCHVNYVHSFESDHPEFDRWPFTQRTGIAFDHVSHGMKHFIEKGETFDCRQCHIDDDRGNVKLVAPFDISCGKCHESRIIGDQNPQWTVFELPMIDTEALKSAGYSVGLWPEHCSGDFDGQLPPAMRILLMSNPRIAGILERQGKDFQFADLNPDDPDDLADAAELAWSIKELLFGLSVNGTREMRDRLNAALETELEQRQLKPLTHGLNEAVFAQAQQHWMPGLLSEMTARNAALNRFEQLEPNQIFARPQSPDEETLAINPLAHLYSHSADTTPDIAAEPDADVNETPALAQTPNVVVMPATPRQDGHVVNSHAGSSNQDDVLANNPLTNMNSGPPSQGTESISPKELRTTIESALAKLPGYEDGSGWNRNDDQFRISWRVTEHRDPVVKSWTELAMKYHRHRAVDQSRLFDALNSPEAAGQCRSCHTADKINDRVAMNWGPKYRNVAVRGFTRFSHRPHDIQTTLQDCTGCHQLDETRCNMDSFTTLNNSGFVSNFVPLSKHNCATCHRPGGAPDGCVDCHNYHVGSVLPEPR